MIQRCLAICRECSDLIGRPAVQAFGNPDAMTHWITAHTRGAATPHTVRSFAGWLPPGEAWARAFGIPQPRAAADTRPALDKQEP